MVMLSLASKWGVCRLSVFRFLLLWPSPLCLRVQTICQNKEDLAGVPCWGKLSQLPGPR
jgi:hypothetical protein